MLDFVTMHGRRVVASATALDAAQWPDGALVLRLAPDDVFVIGPGDLAVDDEHAIVCDEAGWSGVWLPVDVFEALAQSHIHWSVPGQRPAFAQGLMAQIPVKLWLENERVLVLTATVSRHELMERLA